MAIIALPFPEPSAAVLHAFERIAAENERSPSAHHLSDSERLPRPWEPASCPPSLRRELWKWCEAAATWINHEYAWRPVHMIPACWPHHPHIARELAALACQRWMAEQATTPELIEEWHRHTLPMFIDRAASRLGEGRCRDDAHQEWPAQPRYASFIAEAARQRRVQTFMADGAPRPNCPGTR